MEKYIMYRYEDGTIIIQESEYIEHGFFFTIKDKEITLHEIPYGGGIPQLCKKSFDSISEAIEYSKRLT